MATERQKIAAKKLSENFGSKKPKPIGAILRESGYSDETSETPKHILKGKGFQEILEEIAPDDLIAEKLKEYLDLEEVVIKPMEGGGFDAVPTGQPHKQRLDAIKELNKVKDKYPASKRAIDITTKGERINAFKDVDTAELEAMLDE